MTLTTEEKKQCKGRESMVLTQDHDPVTGKPIAGSMPGGVDAQGFARWYDSRTGKPHKLPTDPYSFQVYAHRGFMPGKAPEELRLKWEAGEAERVAECSRRAAEAAVSPEGQRIAGDASSNLDEAIARGVLKVLKTLGFDPTALEAAEMPTVTADEKSIRMDNSEPTTDPEVQLKML